MWFPWKLWHSTACSLSLTHIIWKGQLVLWHGPGDTCHTQLTLGIERYESHKKLWSLMDFPWIELQLELATAYPVDIDVWLRLVFPTHSLFCFGFLWTRWLCLGNASRSRFHELRAHQKPKISRNLPIERPFGLFMSCDLFATHLTGNFLRVYDTFFSSALNSFSQFHSRNQPISRLIWFLQQLSPPAYRSARPLSLFAAHFIVFFF